MFFVQHHGSREGGTWAVFKRYAWGWWLIEARRSACLVAALPSLLSSRVCAPAARPSPSQTQPPSRLAPPPQDVLRVPPWDMVSWGLGAGDTVVFSLGALRLLRLRNLFSGFKCARLPALPHCQPRRRPPARPWLINAP